MCYHCATNPSIMAVLSLLSHYGVTFTVTSSRCRLHVGHGFIVAITVSPLSSHRCSAFAVASLQFHHHHCGFVITVVVLLSLSWCRLHHRIVTVLLSLSWCHLCICHGFVVAVTVLPLGQSWFHVHRRGVAFTLVTVSSLPLRCCLHCHIVTVSSSQLHCCGAFAVASLWFHRHHCSVAFIIALSQCSLPFHHCRHGVAFIIASSRCRHRGFVVVVLLSPFCCCGFVIAVLLLWFCCCCFVVAVLLLFSLLHHRGFVVASWCRRCHGCGHGCGCGHHGHGCGRIVVIAVVVVSLWSLLLHRGRCC